MSRTGLSYEEVVGAIERILALGEKPTIHRVREMLGNYGSVTTISKFLRDWREATGVPVSVLDEEGETRVFTPPQATVGHSVPKPQLIVPEVFELEPLVSEKPKRFIRRQGFDPQAHSEVPVEQPQAAVMPPLAAPTAVHTPVAPVDGNRRGQQAPMGNDDGNRAVAKAAPTAAAWSGNRVDQQQAYPEPPESLKAYAEQFSAAQSSNGQWPAPDDIDSLDKEGLKVRVRRLESFLNKEQARREAAETMAHEAKAYADTVKSMVANRINEIRQTMQETITQLKLELRECQTRADQEVLRYQDILEKANRVLVEQQTHHRQEPFDGRHQGYAARSAE